MLAKLVTTIAHKFSGSKESFNNTDALSGASVTALLVTLVVYLLLVLLLGKWLWNNVLCKTVTFAKPMPSVFTLLGLIILLNLVLPN